MPFLLFRNSQVSSCPPQNTAAIGETVVRGLQVCVLLRLIRIAQEDGVSAAKKTVIRKTGVWAW